METRFAPGTLVEARGREWVVLPDSNDDIYMLRPLGGVDEEVIGINCHIEKIESANFDYPNPERAGNYNACKLLRDAARISTRAAAGPFRSFGRIAVEPRPYQMVPLLMAMKLDPVRLMIADDVGIGKTIEACLIARELLDRGEITSMAVLCPPHLAEQWQKELEEKFHIKAELVLSSTVQRLERECFGADESIFDLHKIVIISTDFIKQKGRKDEFIRKCPELVIVDEAHTCTLSGRVGQARQARHDLVKRISEDTDRHLLLVTATPHSGNEDAFQSLVALLDPKFSTLPEDLDTEERSAVRSELAKHLVQRLRDNIRDYLGSETSFPQRQDGEASYKLTDSYRALFRKVMAYASEMVSDESGNRRTQRVRWWSALALLRALASSPMAAAATLRNRAATADSETDEDVEEAGRRAVLDQDELEISEVFDVSPGADLSAEESSSRTRLRQLAREAEALADDKQDAKLKKAITLIKTLVKEGHNPIIFCRFIDTAEYVADWLRKKIPKVEVGAITGLIPPKEREDRIKELAENERRILVCTDCLSEGVNLQTYFDAVMHYDLSWNPTRHEQREGHVDRYGQPSKLVQVITYFGQDNQIDGVVLEVLLRKHKRIKSRLGISVAVPGSSEEAINALFEGMQLRGADTSDQMFLPGFEPTKEDLHDRWDIAVKQEERSRSRFAQLSISPEEVDAELQAVRHAIGTGPTIKEFFQNSLHLANVPVNTKPTGIVDVSISHNTTRSLCHAIGQEEPFRGKFDMPVDEGVIYLARTNPIVEGLASYVLDCALDEVQAADQPTIAQRCGLVRTAGVTERTSLLLVRFRFHLLVKHRKADDEKPLLAEEIFSMAFTGAADDPIWLAEKLSQSLLDAAPSSNVPPSLVKSQVEMLVEDIPSLMPHVEAMAKKRGDELKEAHNRVRKSAKATGSVRVKPVLPADILGCFVLLPEDM